MLTHCIQKRVNTFNAGEVGMRDGKGGVFQLPIYRQSTVSSRHPIFHP